MPSLGGRATGYRQLFFLSIEEPQLQGSFVFAKGRKSEPILLRLFNEFAFEAYACQVIKPCARRLEEKCCDRYKGPREANDATAIFLPGSRNEMAPRPAVGRVAHVAE